MYKRPYSTSGLNRPILSSDDHSSSSSTTEGSNDDFDVRIFSHEKLSAIRSSQSTPSHKSMNISPNSQFTLDDFNFTQSTILDDPSLITTPSNSNGVLLATKEGSMRRANSNYSKVRRKRVHDVHTPTHVDFDEVIFEDRPHTSQASLPPAHGMVLNKESSPKNSSLTVNNNTNLSHASDVKNNMHIEVPAYHHPTHKTRSSMDISVKLPTNLIIPQHRQYSSFRNSPMSLSPIGADTNPSKTPNRFSPSMRHTESNVELPKLRMSNKSRSSLNVTDALTADQQLTSSNNDVTPRLEPIPLSTRSSRANIDFVIDISSEEVKRDVLPSPVVNQNMKEKFSSEKTKTDTFYNDVHMSKKESKKVDSNSIFFYSLKKVLNKTCSLVLKPSECIEFVECKGLGSVYLVPESEKPKRTSPQPALEKKKSKKINLPLMDDLSDDEIGRFLMESDEEEDNASNYKALVLYDSWEGIDLCTKSLTEEVDDRVTIFGNENEVNEYHIIIRGDVKVYYRNRYDLAVKNK